MIDPIVSLAFSLYSSPGIHALLLGSGMSHAAGIPTGWEIILDLTRKIAHMAGEDCEPEPEVWYRSKYGKEPNYYELLQSVARSPVERNRLLRGYFEPTEEERQQGLKTPTRAHTAIADLVAGGFLRVIMTTNFDRLLEQALENRGVVPTVISTPDAAAGAVPIMHNACTVIKLHGDYLDPRIKNTTEELSKFDRSVSRLLDRVLDEFGLILCGWSAEWDVGLRRTIERCRNNRFTTYWAVRGRIRDNAARLIELRRAVTIPIVDADSFFQATTDKVLAMKEFSMPHPLSAKIAVASLKKYIVQPQSKINLNDLVTGETERLYGEMGEQQFSPQTAFGVAELAKRVHRYKALSEIVLALFATGCYWGEKEHISLWVRCLQRIANPPGGGAGVRTWLNLRLYPALLLLYSGGIASVAAGRYHTLAALLLRVKMRTNYGELASALRLRPAYVMDRNVEQNFPGMAQCQTPVSDHLFQVLRDQFRDFLPDDAEYERNFDRFEYMFALVEADLSQKEGRGYSGFVGRFSWKDAENSPDHASQYEAEAKEMGGDWPPLVAGLFDGKMERFLAVKAAFDKFITDLHWRWN